MEVNALKGVTDVGSKFGLANLVEAFKVWNGTGLMELPKKIIKGNHRSSIDHKFVPVRAFAHNFVLCLLLLDDLLEIPWEGEDITVFALAENEICTDFAVVLLKTGLFLSFRLSGLNGTSAEKSDAVRGLEEAPSGMSGDS